MNKSSNAQNAKPVEQQVSERRNSPVMTQEEMLAAYRGMVLIRRFEERTGQLYGMGLIGGFCHLYIGQEAVVTGVQMASRKGGDAQITRYRDQAHTLAS